MHRLPPLLSQPYSRSCLHDHVQIVGGGGGRQGKCARTHLAIAGTFCTTFVGETPARSCRTTFVGDGVVVAAVVVVLLVVVAFVAFLGGGHCAMGLLARSGTTPPPYFIAVTSTLHLGHLFVAQPPNHLNAHSRQYVQNPGQFISTGSRNAPLHIAQVSVWWGNV